MLKYGVFLFPPGTLVELYHGYHLINLIKIDATNSRITCFLYVPNLSSELAHPVYRS
jgi:hypothetical protein